MIPDVQKGELEGVLILTPRNFRDDRGSFMETWNRKDYADIGLDEDFVQDNLSISRRGVLRGLHYQVAPHAQGKLVGVFAGEVLDIMVDLRPGSSSYGRFEKQHLSSDNRRQVYIPPGFAHGFQVLSDSAIFHYKCTHGYHPASERTLRHDDPDLAIDWPLPPMLSDKDRRGSLFREL